MNNLKTKNMKKKSYSTASFNTEGIWLIPMILGWSKSTVSMGSHPIGIMYTIHITPFFNIGVNNPKPKYKPLTEQEDFYGGCECDWDCECNCGCFNEEIEKIAHENILDFISTSDHSKIFGYYSDEDDDHNRIYIFMVSDENVEIPEDFNGFKTRKEITLKDN